MCEMAAVFHTQFTNSRKTWKINKKTAKMRFYLFWQGHLCNSRTDEIKDLLQFGKEIKLFLNKYEYLLIPR